MNDTSHGMETRFRTMMMKKSGQERMKMGFSMFNTARKQVVASIKMKNPDAGDNKIRKEIFLRFYGSDFSPEESVKIMASLKDCGEI